MPYSSLWATNRTMSVCLSVYLSMMIIFIHHQVVERKKKKKMKKALRETQTLRARWLFGSDTARPLSQTHRQDRLQYTAPQLASAQCNNNNLTKLNYYNIHSTISPRNNQQNEVLQNTLSHRR